MPKDFNKKEHIAYTWLKSGAWPRKTETFWENMRALLPNIKYFEYKDRLARFGYEYLDAIFTNLEIEVEIMETKEKKYEEELAEDIMKILTCYSARYYGARGGRKKKNQAENTPVESNGI